MATRAQQTNDRRTANQAYRLLDAINAVYAGESKRIDFGAFLHGKVHPEPVLISVYRMGESKTVVGAYFGAVRVDVRATKPVKLTVR